MGMMKKFWIWVIVVMSLGLSAYADGVTDQEIDIQHLSLIENDIKTSHGITYEGKDGEWHIYGIPEKTSFMTLAGGIDTIPEWMESGKDLFVYFSSDTSVRLLFRAFNDENPDGITLFSTQENAVFNIPDLNEYSGLAIRIQIPGGGIAVDTYVHPVLSYERAKFGPPMLTIIDDDGDIHYLKDIFPLCEELDVPIATAVTTTRIGSQSRWMSWEETKMCYDRGIEVLCHMYSHPTPVQLEDVSDEEIVDRLSVALRTLQDNEIETGDILVYSSSTGYIERVRDAASRVFNAGIVIGGNQLNTKDSDIFNLKRYRIDYAAGDGDTTKQDYDLEDMKEYVDTVVTNGGWAIWMFHTSNSKWRQLVAVDGDGNVIRDETGNVVRLFDEQGNPILDEDGSQYERTYGHLVYVPMFRTVINYARENGVEIVTARDGLEAYFDK